MERMLLFVVVLAIVAVIVAGKLREDRASASAAGAAIGIHEATRVKGLICHIPMSAQEAAARLADGTVAGELVSTWDAERGAYCFRSELPDGSAPMYFAAEFTPVQGGTRLSLTRQRTILHGRRDAILLLPGCLKAKLQATDFRWITDPAGRAAL